MFSGTRRRQVSQAYNNDSVFAHDVLKDPKEGPGLPRTCFNICIIVFSICATLCFAGYILSPVEVIPKDVFRIALTNKFTPNELLLSGKR